MSRLDGRQNGCPNTAGSYCHAGAIGFTPEPDFGECFMKIADVRSRAFAMPLTSPSYPPGPYRFYNR
jgi:hypothetical protein